MSTQPAVLTLIKHMPNNKIGAIVITDSQKDPAVLQQLYCIMHARCCYEMNTAVCCPAHKVTCQVWTQCDVSQHAVYLPSLTCQCSPEGRHRHS